MKVLSITDGSAHNIKSTVTGIPKVVYEYTLVEEM